MVKTLFFSIWLLFHPVHVTLTSVDFIPGINCFKVFVKMYFDDFLLDCKLHGGVIETSYFSADSSSSKDVLEKYLNQMVILKVNDKLLSGILQDIKMEDNEISTNMVYSGEKKPKIIVVKNMIMTKLYPDQSNMMIVKVNDFEEGVKLTSDLTEQTFKIK